MNSIPSHGNERSFMSKRILILSASVGAGHLRAAEAVELALRQTLPEAIVRNVDVLEMTNRLFFKYPSRKNPLGNRQTVGSSTTEMMRLIQQRYYVPNNSALVVTGDVNSTEVVKMRDG